MYKQQVSVIMHVCAVHCVRLCEQQCNSKEFKHCRIFLLSLPSAFHHPLSPRSLPQLADGRILSMKKILVRALRELHSSSLHFFCLICRFTASQELIKCQDGLVKTPADRKYHQLSPPFMTNISARRLSQQSVTAP